MAVRLKSGDTLEGKYLIRRKMGEGGMGVVYEGQHLDLEMRVAIKVLHPIEANDPSMKDRFKTEAKSAASIKNVNVVEVYDYGLTPDKRPFFVMEFLEGESLADLLDGGGRISQHQAVQITDEILNGLRPAHKRNIIHRDLKPENIFLSRTEDGKQIVKILDFGIAKIMNEGRTRAIDADALRKSRRATRRFKTEHGVVMGTPGYMAPETLTGQDEVDTRADLFAVGVLLFEMLTRRQPFRGETAHEIMLNTANKPVPNMRAINPKISKEMEQCCLIALAKKPTHRFTDTQEFLRYLTAAAVGRMPEDGRKCRTDIGSPSLVPEPRKGELEIDTSDYKEIHNKKASPNPFGPPPTSRAASSDAARQNATQNPYNGSYNTYRGPARKKRVLMPFSLIQVFVYLAIISGAGYFVWTSALFQSPVNTKNGETINTSTAEKRARDLNQQAVEEQVTIWVEIAPPDAKVYWNDELMITRPLKVAHGTKPAKVEIVKDGYHKKILVVTPNVEKTISAELTPKK